ncbi:MAG: sigma-70 family RNA polymerase sigma factor [Acidobacteria bacterium]|nr:sigma-70 family RNA polymerase sigma factor [Acidobacteriota bacterium]MBI3473939.1 sigma-70 family RNA polymerase sigma factor [Candidatus Solibacter usitatus]
MLRFQRGEAASLDLLLEKHRTPVIYFLHRMVGNRAVAEELAQDTFLRVYRSQASYQPTAKFTTWLYRIATNLAINWLRDHRHEKNGESLDAPSASGLRPQIVDPSPAADSELQKQEMLRQLRQAVAELPDRQRAAVLMHKYQGMELSQISGALGCSLATVKSRLFRAYATLRMRLAQPAAR